MITKQNPRQPKRQKDKGHALDIAALSDRKKTSPQKRSGMARVVDWISVLPA